MKPLLTVLLILIFFSCIAQRNADSLFFEEMPEKKISLDQKQPDTIYSLPFHNVKIWDARADTTSIGFKKRDIIGINNGIAKLCFESGLSNTFFYFINNNYKLTNDTNDLLILIKEFRVSEYATKGHINDITVSSWNSGMIVSAELFLNTNNKYNALYKIDSLLIESSQNETLSELITESFRLILKKAENKNLTQIHIGKAVFSFDDVQKHVNSFYDFPILKDLVLRKGVYKNYNEFKLNNPSILNYEVDKGKLSDELFITDNNQSYPLQNFWGYCDGKRLFIYSAKNLFQLYRTGNTFDTKAMKSFKTRTTTIKDTVTNVLGNLILTGRQSNDYLRNGEFKLDITAFQLNMQNGELY